MKNVLAIEFVACCVSACSTKLGVAARKCILVSFLTGLCLPLFGQSVRYEGNAGIMNFVSIGKDQYSTQIQLLTEHGVLLGDSFAIGMGTGLGFDYANHNYLVPVYLNSKYYFPAKVQNSRIYAGAQVGMYFSEEMDFVDAEFVSGYLGWRYKWLSFNVGLKNQVSHKMTNIISNGYVVRQEHSRSWNSWLFGGVFFNF